MKKSTAAKKQSYGARMRTVSLSRYFNWPDRGRRGAWWRELAKHVAGYPSGRQTAQGIRFSMGQGRAVLATREDGDVRVPLSGKATYVCFLHEWRQLPDAVRSKDPTEGLVIGEYELVYADGTRRVQPVRARFEVTMVESPGPAWMAKPFQMERTVDPTGRVPGDMQWGRLQTGAYNPAGHPLVYAMPNPTPRKPLRALVIRGVQESPLLVAGLTLYEGESHPLAQLPRRTYRVKAGRKPPRIAKADIDMGLIVRTEHTSGPRGTEWVRSPYAGTSQGIEPERGAEDLLEIVGTEDATVSLSLDQDGKKKTHHFSLGAAFADGQSRSKNASLEVLGKRRQWMQIRVIDQSTGRPTPTRIHLSGARGEYLAPYGHHSQINANWFEDYGADVVVGGRNYAYVPGEFTSDMPVGDVYVEVSKGFEYTPIRKKVTIRPGQKKLDLKIDRWIDLRSSGWVTADTHVHFLSPHTAWLEGQAEGVNVVNLLASQWGRLFTNVGDITGRVGVVEDDTIVYVGTENRNHMLGHMSMLGTKGLPVFPMCCGQLSEAWVGDGEFMALAEWAMENKRKGGVVIRPHYPFCGHTEDPLPILKGLVDALEINVTRSNGFPVQEWYRYLNCGYRVAVAGGTDKMGAYTALGWMRTYAKLNPNRPFTYNEWGKAMRAGRTVTTNGPVMNLHVEGKEIGELIELSPSGATLHVQATAESVWPLRTLEVVCNGRVVAATKSRKGSRRLRISEGVSIPRSGWIAARCYGCKGTPGGYSAAHTSPVYIRCGDTRAFDGPAAEHMLALVEGGMEYLQTIATAFDERSRKRMVKLFKEAQAELKGRLVVEAGHTHHHGNGAYHTHGHGKRADHRH